MSLKMDGALVRKPPGSLQVSIIAWWHRQMKAWAARNWLQNTGRSADESAALTRGDKASNSAEIFWKAWKI